MTKKLTKKIMNQHETMLAWLKDAYAMENSIAETLERHKEDAKDYPDVKTAIEKHLEETKQQAVRVKKCIEEFGGEVSAIKKVGSAIMGAVAGMANKTSGDAIIKNALSEYSTEYFEIASYTCIKTAAKNMGHDQVVLLCEEIIAEEQKTADWIESNLPELTKKYLGKLYAVKS